MKLKKIMKIQNRYKWVLQCDQLKNLFLGGKRLLLWYNINIVLILIIPFKENVPNILEARSEIYEMQICNYTQTYP